MKTINKTINNERGFVLIVSLLMLMVLMIIGIAATNTTTIELGISGNDKLSKQTFYQAEGVVAEAVRIIFNDSSSNLEDPLQFTWLHLDPVGSGILTVGGSGTEESDVHSDAFWTAANSTPSLLPVTGSQKLQMTAAFRGIIQGGSLSLGSSRVHAYDVYGRSRQNNSLAIIKEGCRVPF